MRPWWERPIGERGHRCGDHKSKKTGDVHRNRAGNPCGARIGNHEIACGFHGGKAPQVERAAKTRAAFNAAYDIASRMVARHDVDKDPIVHLLDCLHLAAALVQVWGQFVADLDHAQEVELQDRPGEIRGFARKVWTPAELDNDGKVISKGHYEVQVDRLLTAGKDKFHLHPFVVEYGRALDAKAKYAKLCIDAGVQQQIVTWATAQSSAWVEAFITVIDTPTLELTAKQRMEARKMLATKLRELEAAA